VIWQSPCNYGLLSQVLGLGTLLTHFCRDTAGFERFNSLGATFFRGADCCVYVGRPTFLHELTDDLLNRLVFDLTSNESLARLDHWKKEFVEQTSIDDQAFPFARICSLTSFSRGFNLGFLQLYVGNKYDLAEARQVDHQRAKQFCADRNGLMYIETSAKVSSHLTTSLAALIISPFPHRQQKM